MASVRNASPMADYIDAFRDTGSTQLHPCSACGRTFNHNTLTRHEAICQKRTRKTKIFDSSKQRMQDMQSEVANLKVNTTNVPPKPKKANWRQKHEEFVSAIRGARGVTVAQKRGDPLPPAPPPTINPDYVQCPHCSRRFNEHSAERHIDFCKEQRARIVKPSSKTVASEKFTRRTQYKPPLPGKKNYAPSSAVSTSKVSPAKIRRNPVSAPPSSRRKLLSDPDLRSGVQVDQKKKWSLGSSPSQSRKKPSAESNGIALQRTWSGDMESDDDTLLRTREVKYGRRNNQSDSDNEKADAYVHSTRRRRERPDSNSSENSERTSSGRRSRHTAIRDPSPTLFDDFGIQTQAQGNPKNPFSAKAHLHRGSEETNAAETQSTQSVGGRLSKFCHECGTRYPVANAKFCCECGTKRLYIKP